VLLPSRSLPSQEDVDAIRKLTSVKRLSLVVLIEQLGLETLTVHLYMVGLLMAITCAMSHMNCHMDTDS